MARYVITGEDPERRIETDDADWAYEISGFLAHHTGSPVSMTDTGSGHVAVFQMTLREEKS